MKQKSLPTAYIAVLDSEHMAIVAKKLISQKRLLFAYQPNLIPYAMVSIEMGHRLLPLVHPKLLKLGGIELRPIIFKVAKVYDNDN
jgi:hypothetical protein